MVFGMLDGVFFKLGPIPVDHIIFTEWVIIGLIGLIAFFATRDMQMVPRGLQNAFEAIIVFTYDFFTQLMDKEHVAKNFLLGAGRCLEPAQRSVGSDQNEQYGRAEDS
jgi:F-type H+-transporting ATPase subunit a